MKVTDLYVKWMMLTITSFHICVSKTKLDFAKMSASCLLYPHVRQSSIMPLYQNLIQCSTLIEFSNIHVEHTPGDAIGLILTIFFLLYGLLLHRNLLLVSLSLQRLVFVSLVTYVCTSNSMICPSLASSQPTTQHSEALYERMRR